MSLHAGFGRGGSRSDRRRRLLAEDRTTSGTATLVGGVPPIVRLADPQPRKSENYGDAAFLDEQPRMTDLIPKKRLTFIAAFLAGMAAILGLVALHTWLPGAMPQLVGRRMAAFDLAAPGSLRACFATLLLLVSAISAIGVYVIRSHKVDDYQGHYRIWLWAAGCWLLMAIDSAASLRDAFREVMTVVTGTRVLGDGAIWWAGPAALLLGAIGSRLVVDMWRCRESSMTLLTAGGCYVVAAAIHFGGLPQPTETDQVVLSHGLLLGGHLLVLLAMGLHARHVLMDAEGLLPRREAEPAKSGSKPEAAVVKPTRPAAKPLVEEAVRDEEDEEIEEEEAAADGEWIAIDPPHGKAGPVLKRVAPAGESAKTPTFTPVPAVKSAPVAAAATDDQKLSKSDRKALKKQLLEERLRRQQQKSSGWGK